MKFRRKVIFGGDLQGLLIGIVLGYLILIQHTLAVEPPEGVLALGEGGYVSADCPDVLDGFGRQGLAIDVWFYLTDLPPEDFQQDWRERRWILLQKPQSYDIFIAGKNPMNVHYELGEISYLIYSMGGGGGGKVYGLSPENSPLNRWVHTAFQMRGAGPVEYAAFYDGEGISNGRRGSAYGFSTSPEPLLVGGGEGHKSIEGWIDEIRISSVWRYTPNQPINPPREFVTDEYTLALWHFDEGPWAPHYADASGNGHTLFAAGTLPVEQSDKMAAMWGRLKSDSAIIHPE